LSGFIEQARASLAGRLRNSCDEIEATTVTRVYAISEPRETADPEYLQGLRASLRVAIDYAIEAIERGEERAPAVPVALLAQARMAARNGVSMETVLRRYFAGYNLLVEFAMREAEEGGLIPRVSWGQLMRGQAAVFERLIDAVSDEHRREMNARPGSGEHRRAERVRRLLAGEPIDAGELPYVLKGFHVGAIASGPGASEALRDVMSRLGKRFLLIPAEGETTWAWVGSREEIDVAGLVCNLRSACPDGSSVVLGEQGQDIAGWRLTHQQAKTAFPIGRRSDRAVVRYADVALLAATLRDDVLVDSLRELYLKPLAEGRDGGQVLRNTLRAYFLAKRNVSSTAAALGVTRRTVTNRLHAIEQRFGRSLDARAPDIELALSLDELSSAQ